MLASYCLTKMIGITYNINAKFYMSYKVNPKEFDSVIALSEFDRYQYFLNKVADWEEVWSIGKSEGWRMMSDNEGTICVPVWPAEEYAAACCSEEWSQDEPKVILLDDWMVKWLPGIKKDGRKIAVFPIPICKGTIVESDQLLADLQEILTEFD